MRPFLNAHTHIRNVLAQKDSYFFSTNHTAIMDAKRYGGHDNMELRLGQLSRDPYRDNCECLIPLYKRQYDSYRCKRCARVLYREHALGFAVSCYLPDDSDI